MWGPMSHLEMHKVESEKDEFMCGYDYIGEEYSPIGRDIFITGDPFDMKAKEASNFKRLEKVHPSYVELVDKENRKARERKFGVINKLDPEKRALNYGVLNKFLTMDGEIDGHDKGTDYLILDDFREQFQY